MKKMRNLNEQKPLLLRSVNWKVQGIVQGHSSKSQTEHCTGETGELIGLNYIWTPNTYYPNTYYKPLMRLRRAFFWRRFMENGGWRRKWSGSGLGSFCFIRVVWLIRIMRSVPMCNVLFGTSSWKCIRWVHIQVLYLTKWTTDTQIQHANDWDFVASSGLCCRLYRSRSPVLNEALYEIETTAFSFVCWEKDILNSREVSWPLSLHRGEFIWHMSLPTTRRMWFLFQW